MFKKLLLKYFTFSFEQQMNRCGYERRTQQRQFREKIRLKIFPSWQTQQKKYARYFVAFCSFFAYCFIRIIVF